jgi:4a-hydroxytetrahydrobiopterin dehydratase
MVCSTLLPITNPNKHVVTKDCNEWPLIEDLQVLKSLASKLDSWEIVHEEILPSVSNPNNKHSINKLIKNIQLKDFISAVNYINKIAAVAELRNHHPDLHLTSFKNVKIVIFTFGLGGLTENDFNLAKAIDEIEN